MKNISMSQLFDLEFNQGLTINQWHKLISLSNEFKSDAENKFYSKNLSDVWLEYKELNKEEFNKVRNQMLSILNKL